MSSAAQTTLKQLFRQLMSFELLAFRTYKTMWSSHISQVPNAIGFNTEEIIKPGKSGWQCHKVRVIFVFAYVLLHTVSLPHKNCDTLPLHRIWCPLRDLSARCRSAPRPD